MEKLTYVEMFTDGACSGNPGPGGWGSILMYKGNILNFVNFVVNVKEVFELSNAMMITYLAGEGQSEAIYNNVFGLSNPSGRLPETWIYSLNQNPINEEYRRRDIYHTYYHDDIFVGYRYYDLVQTDFLLPFGYGLSYSKFEYSNYAYEFLNDKLIVTLDVKNTSNIDGYDVVEVYVGKEKSNIYRPLKELKGFSKVFVKANETVKCVVEVNVKDLASYRNETDSFEIEEGQYEIYVALNTKDILDKQINGLNKAKSLKIRLR